MMFSHVMVGVEDLQAARRFYEPLLDALGLVRKFADSAWVGWMPATSDRPLFIVARPFDGRPATAGNGQMAAFLADSRATVDRCYALGLANGGTSEGEPGVRPQYHEAYYGAYLRDPEGNKLCVCCHGLE